jgi:hypothetical protein
MTIKIAEIPTEPSSPLAGELKEYIGQKHPRYDYRDCLDLIIEIFEQRSSGRNPRTGDLARALGLKNSKIINLAEAIEPKYVRINRAVSGRFYVRIESDFHCSRDVQEREFESVLNELEEFVQDVLPGITNERVHRAIDVLYPDILGLNEQGDLYKAIKKYHELILILDLEGERHDLRDADLGITAHQYILTESGEDVYYAWQRGEFSGNPNLTEE